MPRSDFELVLGVRAGEVERVGRSLAQIVGSGAVVPLVGRQRVESPGPVKADCVAGCKSRRCRRSHCFPGCNSSRVPPPAPATKLTLSLTAFMNSKVAPPEMSDVPVPVMVFSKSTTPTPSALIVPSFSTVASIVALPGKKSVPVVGVCAALRGGDADVRGVERSEAADAKTPVFDCKRTGDGQFGSGHGADPDCRIRVVEDDRRHCLRAFDHDSLSRGPADAGGARSRGRAGRIPIARRVPVSRSASSSWANPGKSSQVAGRRGRFMVVGQKSIRWVVLRPIFEGSIQPWLGALE